MFITIHGTTGITHAVNVNHIVQIFECRELVTAKSVVVLSTESSIMTMESYSDVCARLEDLVEVAKIL